MVHADMGEPDQRCLDANVVSVHYTVECERQWENDCMHQVVDDLPRAFINGIRDDREIGREQEEEEGSPTKILICI